ncbi:hyaluronidase [Dendroctonus ponderosae]|uniref:hyaluronidase n=1 Tax=Dendroctonus ponderosae TaxID=77166 RepID=UPI0020362703|nr:hyaluronidase [Dendroctonus ponderosae]
MGLFHKCLMCALLFKFQDKFESKVAKKPLQVFWNVPSFQCNPFKLNFTKPLNKYGIVYNKDAAFRGQQINILYDPGNFPAILKNGKDNFLRNGGVPQEGNLSSHLRIFDEIVDQLIPNKQFSGLAIIDFESWRPIFRQNWGVLTPYKELSEKLEKKRHPIWSEAWIKKEAAKRFEEGANKFLEATITRAKSLRPKASWGYYHYPYCFFSTTQKTCAKEVLSENDSIKWLFNISDAFFPSVYLQESYSPQERVQYIERSLAEALRLRNQLKTHKKIYVYFWYQFQDTGNYISEEQLYLPLKAIAKYNIDGMVLWGASANVNSKSKCLQLHEYVDKVFGPSLVQV